MRTNAGALDEDPRRPAALTAQAARAGHPLP